MPCQTGLALLALFLPEMLGHSGFRLGTCLLAGPPVLREAVRHASGTDLLRVEHRGVRGRGRAAGAGQAGAAGAVRLRRRACRPGAGAGRKGWLTALRDTAALKTAYAFGLRRRELVMLDLADFGANPHAPEFGGYGVVYVRWGKASKGGPPKRRSVLTVFPWSVRVLGQWARHAALDTFGAERAVEYLRCLLVRYGVLPPGDRRMADFQRWAATKLDAIGNAEHRRLLERFSPR